MSKRTRQYVSLIAAVVSYYLIHEGAHLLYALATGVFKEPKREFHYQSLFRCSFHLMD